MLLALAVHPLVRQLSLVLEVDLRADRHAAAIYMAHAGALPPTVMARALPGTLWRWQAHCRAQCVTSRRTAAHILALAGVLPRTLWG